MQCGIASTISYGSQSTEERYCMESYENILEKCSEGLARQKESRVMEGHLMPDPVHMFISIPSTEVCGGTGYRFYEREECDSYCQDVWGEEEKLRWRTFLGEGVLRIDGRER